jgi:hypothetical protein
MPHAAPRVSLVHALASLRGPAAFRVHTQLELGGAARRVNLQHPPNMLNLSDGNLLVRSPEA